MRKSLPSPSGSRLLRWDPDFGGSECATFLRSQGLSLLTVPPTFSLAQSRIIINRGPLSELHLLRKYPQTSPLGPRQVKAFQKDDGTANDQGHRAQQNSRSHVLSEFRRFS